MIDLSRITITTLSENSVADIGYAAEWGLSLHIDIQDGPTILFDTGGGDTCVFNANVAGIRLSDVDMILLSHGHADHTGGLYSVLNQIRNETPAKDSIPTVCHPAALEPQYIIKPDKQYYYQGCPFTRDQLESLGADFLLSEKPRMFEDGDIVFSGEVPMVTDFEAVAPILFLKQAGAYVDSPVQDDQSLFIKTDQGILVIAGCAHRGIVNTMLHARTLTGMDDIFMVIGGIHLLNTSRLQQEMTLELLNQFNVSSVGVSHCTGMKPAGFLAQNLGFDRFFYNNAGTRIDFKEGRPLIRAFEKYE